RERGHVTLRYIPRPEAPPRDVLEATLRRRLHVKLGDDVDLRFEPVASIPLTARGKHRFLIQELPIAQHDIGAHPAWAMERR
ncbi:MAG: hypothetical protein NZ518_10495, partial [Dehalococcoidia bacterium]|nr:hypothetical protein [Dehalococcoidia bacterium]